MVTKAVYSGSAGKRTRRSRRKRSRGEKGKLVCEERDCEEGSTDLTFFLEALEQVLLLTQQIDDVC